VSSRDNTCVCCGTNYGQREDPWEGRLDGYCYECALARCDAYPDECPRLDREFRSFTSAEEALKWLRDPEAA
jgi:hypothetical protein